MYERLPNVDRRLPDHIYGVLSSQVERGKDTVTTFLTKNFHQSLAGRLCESSFLCFLILFNLGFSADTRDLEQQLSNESDRGLLHIGVRQGHVPI